MGIRIYKPLTPGTRNRSVAYGALSTVLPKEQNKKRLKSHLVYSWSKKSGRNHRGKITSKHRGGGHKKLYRNIDFLRRASAPQLNSTTGKVVRIEYDPYRSSHIALIHYTNGKKGYILCPRGLSLGRVVVGGVDAPLSVGNALPLSKMPLGTEVHNVELNPGAGGKLVRAAGTAAQLVARLGKFVAIRLPSKELRLVSNNCWATIGQVGNNELTNLVLGKAGRSRWLGQRPRVRGSAKNPVDHPHGGGEGKSPIGRSRPVTPWGKPALGQRTGKPNQFVIERRTK